MSGSATFPEQFSGRCRDSRSANLRQWLPRFSPRAVLDLTVTDASLKCFTGGFSDAIYDNLVPYPDGAYFGEVPRFMLSVFSTEAVLDLTIADVVLNGFAGRFSDGTYGYLVPLWSRAIAR